MMTIFRRKKIILLFVALAIVYLWQSALVTPSQEILDKYHISAGQAALLSLGIALPYILIWMVAMVGYLRFKSYAEPIKNSKDGAAFWAISKGLFLLALWLPVSAIISSLSAHFYHPHPSSTANLIRFSNYFNLVMLFAAFWIINRGSQKLLGLIRMRLPAYSERAILLFISFAALYTWLVLHDPVRALPGHRTLVASHYEPDWLIITTLVIPQLIMWFLGLQAVLNISMYQKKAKGLLYKRGINRLALGLGWVIIGVIVLRCFQSLSSQIGSFGLGLLLMIIFALLVLLSVGYLMVASGAKLLKRIEDS